MNEISSIAFPSLMISHNSISEKGPRVENQDMVLIEEFDDQTALFLVVDGMGGHAKGRETAALVTKTLQEEFKKETQKPGRFKITSVFKPFMVANQMVAKFRLENDNQVMGATVAGVLKKSDQLYGFWIGDSRVYLLRDQLIQFQSIDHSLINELVREGVEIDEQLLGKYKSVVTRGITGGDENHLPEVKFLGKIEEGDQVFICSDGVHEVIDEAFLSIKIAKKQFMDEVAQKCADRSTDNYSCIKIGF